MADISRARAALVRRILEGDGRAPTDQRRAAFNNAGLAEPIRTLVDKVSRCSQKVTDGDIASAKESGHTEDQIFELVVCAAVGQASRQYDAALDGLRSASEKD